VELRIEFYVGLDMYLVIQIQPSNGLRISIITAALLRGFSAFCQQPFLALGWDGRRRSRVMRRARHDFVDNTEPVGGTRSMLLCGSSEKRAPPGGCWADLKSG
jgi:hypothetical protein